MKRLNDILLSAFIALVLFSALVLNGDAANRTKLLGFSLLIVPYFSVRILFELISVKNTLIFSDIKKLLCFAFILFGMYEAGLGLLQLYGFEQSNHGLFRLTGSFFNPGPYAGFLAVIAPVAFYLLFNHKGHERATPPPFVGRGQGGEAIIELSLKIVSALTLAVILLVLPATMSRAAWVAVLVGCIAVMPEKIKNGAKRCNPRLLRTAIIAVAVSIILAGAGLYVLKKDSADGRLLTWKISLQTIVKHPFGTGLGNFAGAYGDTQAEYFASGQGSKTEEWVAGNPEYGFNEFLQIGVESGILAFALFIAICILAAKNLWKNREFGLLGSLLALLVFACFSYPFGLWEFLVLFVFLLAVANTNPDLTNCTGKHRLKKLAFLCIIIVIGVILSRDLYPIFKAEKQWKREQILYHSELYSEAAEAFRRHEPYLNDNTEYLFEYGRSLSMTKDYEESNRILQRAVKISCDPMLYNIMGKNFQALKQYSDAERCFLKAANIVPNRLYPWYLLAKLYEETGQTDKAAAAAEIVLTRKPKTDSKAVEEMRKAVVSGE
jgi:O-antigen ligase